MLDYENGDINNATIKIADLGYSTELGTSGVASTLCGTPINMAPDIINLFNNPNKEQKYNNKVDLWSLGTITYELLIGVPPFYASTHLELFEMVKKGIYSLPNNLRLSIEAISFINGLLQFYPEKRFNWEDIKNHPFITNSYKTFHFVDLKTIDTDFKNPEQLQVDTRNCENFVWLLFQTNFSKLDLDKVDKNIYENPILEKLVASNEKDLSDEYEDANELDIGNPEEHDHINKKEEEEKVEEDDIIPNNYNVEDFNEQEKCEEKKKEDQSNEEEDNIIIQLNAEKEGEMVDNIIQEEEPKTYEVKEADYNFIQIYANENDVKENVDQNVLLVKFEEEINNQINQLEENYDNQIAKEGEELNINDEESQQKEEPKIEENSESEIPEKVFENKIEANLLPIHEESFNQQEEKSRELPKALNLEELPENPPINLFNSKSQNITSMISNSLDNKTEQQLVDENQTENESDKWELISSISDTVERDLNRSYEIINEYFN
jgi:serine/threonine-protein kinase ULK/ATG1